MSSSQARSSVVSTGADLVQVYTGIVYRGPALLDEILAELGARVRAAASRS